MHENDQGEIVLLQLSKTQKLLYYSTGARLSYVNLFSVLYAKFDLILTRESKIAEPFWR